MLSQRYRILINVFSLCLISSAVMGEVTISNQNGECAWTIGILPPKEDAANFDFTAEDENNLYLSDTNGWKDYNNTGYESAAAHELASLLEQMLGARPDVKILEDSEYAKEHVKLIAIGRLAKALGAAPPESQFGIDGSIVQIWPERILLAGETPLATYFAMVRLAEMAGCRWYMPGPLGEFVPEKESISLAEGAYEEVPAVWSRRPWLSGGLKEADGETRRQFHRWMLHNRQYGVFIQTFHIWNKILPPKVYFEKHPEWYALVDGERSPGMLCTSNAEMRREFIANYRKYIKQHSDQTWFSLSQNDGTAFCQCAECTISDPGPDPMSPNLPQVTDRLVNFYNEVVAELTRDFPDKYFTFYAYMNSTAGPVRETLHPHLMPVIAPMTYSRYHALNASNSETMAILRRHLEDWSTAAEHLGYRWWAFNLGDGILPYTRMHQTEHDIPWLVSRGLATSSCETANAWHNLLPWYHLAARLTVNPAIDIKAETDKFYWDFFGPAAKPMRTYSELLEKAYSELNYEVGGAWFAPLVFTKDFLRSSDRLINKAENKVQDLPKHAQRVSMWRGGLETAHLFMDMYERTNDFDFTGAANTAALLAAHCEGMHKSNPWAQSMYAFKYWWSPAWRNPIEFAAEKVRGGKHLYRFPDTWLAFIDFSEIGTLGEIWRPEFPEDRWIPLKTYSQTIGQQGLTRFRGTIWYRHSFNLDDNDLNGSVHLLFSGVDRELDLYLNGIHITEREASTRNFKAYNYDVTKAVRQGRNTLVCRTNNEYITELETGGIMRPVLLYHPAAKPMKKGSSR